MTQIASTQSIQTVRKAPKLRRNKLGSPAASMIQQISFISRLYRSSRARTSPSPCAS
jgi:hypothetical protein